MAAKLRHVQWARIGLVGVGAGGVVEGDGHGVSFRGGGAAQIGPGGSTSSATTRPAPLVAIV